MEGNQKNATAAASSDGRKEDRKEMLEEEYDHLPDSPSIMIVEEGIEELAEENVAPALMKKLKGQISEGKDRSKDLSTESNRGSLKNVSHKQPHNENDSSGVSGNVSGGVRVVEEGVEEERNDEGFSYIDKVKNIMHIAREKLFKEQPNQAHHASDDHLEENASQTNARDAYGIRVVQESFEEEDGHENPSYVEKMKNVMSKTKEKLKESMVMSRPSLQDESTIDHPDPLLSYQLAVATKNPHSD